MGYGWFGPPMHESRFLFSDCGHVSEGPEKLSLRASPAPAQSSHDERLRRHFGMRKTYRRQVRTVVKEMDNGYEGHGGF